MAVKVDFRVTDDNDIVADVVIKSFPDADGDELINIGQENGKEVEFSLNMLSEIIATLSDIQDSLENPKPKPPPRKKG